MYTLDRFNDNLDNPLIALKQEQQVHTKKKIKIAIRNTNNTQKERQEMSVN